MTGSHAIAAVEMSDARIESMYITTKVNTKPMGDFLNEFGESKKSVADDVELLTWAGRQCPNVTIELMDNGDMVLVGNRTGVEECAEELCSDYGWRQVDAYPDDVPGSGKQYWVVELER